MEKIQKNSLEVKEEILKFLKEEIQNEKELSQKFLGINGLKNQALDLLLLDLSLEYCSKEKTSIKRYAIILATYLRQTQKKKEVKN